MVVIAVANEINFHDFSSLCGLHMAVNINRFPPGEFSPRSTAAPIENLRQFRRATVSCSKGGTRARPRERENRAEKWRGKKKRRRKRKRKRENREGRRKEKYVALVAAQFRVKTLLGLVDIIVFRVERMRATIPRYDN